MDLKDDHWEKLYLFAKDLAKRNIDYDEIKKQLSERTDDPLIVVEIIQQIKKIQYAIHRKNGLIKIGFGALLLLLGFLITCINFHSNQSFTSIMYSTSTIGLALIFWGLYDVMG